jgi:hypothetical protein
MKSCYNCKHNIMCYVRRWIITNFPFDTQSTNYSARFSKFFQMMSENCNTFEKSDENES